MQRSSVKNIKISVFLLILATSISMPTFADQHKHKHAKQNHVAKGHGAKITHKNKLKSQQIKSAKVSGEIYTVKPHDVFGKVAQKYQPAGVSLKKVMKAIYADNKQAFVNGDPKRLIVGAKLQIPASLVRVAENPEGATVKPQTNTSLTKTAHSGIVGQSNPTTKKYASKGSKEVQLLEDDPQNPASQASKPEQVINPTIKQPTTESSSASSQAKLTPVEESEGSVAPSQLSSASQEIQTVQPSGNGMINRFSLIAGLILLFGLILFLRARSKKAQKAQRDLIDQLMEKNNFDDV